MIDFTITEDEYQELLDASQPVMYLMAHASGPITPQERANAVWQKIGDKYGVSWSTIGVVDRSARKFTGSPVAK